MRGFTTLLALFVPFAASAQEATTDAAASPMSSQYASFLPLVLIFGVFYFLLIRPQQKKMKEHQAMLGNLTKGDEIITGGGIYGKITKVDGEKFTVEIAKGIEVSVAKGTISTVLNKQASPIVTNEKKKSGNKNDNAVVSRENVANDN